MGHKYIERHGIMLSLLTLTVHQKRKLYRWKWFSLILKLSKGCKVDVDCQTSDFYLDIQTTALLPFLPHLKLRTPAMLLLAKPSPYSGIHSCGSRLTICEKEIPHCCLCVILKMISCFIDINHESQCKIWAGLEAPAEHGWHGQHRLPTRGLVAALAICSPWCNNQDISVQNLHLHLVLGWLPWSMMMSKNLVDYHDSECLTWCVFTKKLPVILTL